MIRKIGTVNELSSLQAQLPHDLLIPLAKELAILDYSYGAERDPLQSGGYSVILETTEDVAAFRATIDLAQRPCEWADRIPGSSGYASALFLMNDDYSIVVYLPISLAPASILCELE